MKGEHTHEWKYNEVRVGIMNNSMRAYQVIRFCLECLTVEEVELKPNA